MKFRAPIPPHAKGRPRTRLLGRPLLRCPRCGAGLPRDKRVVQTYTPKESEEWEQAFADLVASTHGIAPLPKGPTRADAVYVFNRPKRLGRKSPDGRVWMPCRPDGDNCEKALWDALVTAKLLGDDNQIVQWSGRKVYAAKGEDPCIEVTIGPVRWPYEEGQ